MTSKQLNTHKLWDLKQSPWIDDISKCMIDTGELKRRIYEEGIRGVTTNPSIFDKSISSGNCGYPDEMRKLIEKGLDEVGVYEALSADDVRKAADIMRKLYDESGGDDGFVSWEEDPQWANDEEKSVSEAHRLAKIIDRPNLFVKVPSTTEGASALRRLIRDGVSINMTLIFSLDQYINVAENYLSGLEDRLADGNEIDKVRSVASVFVSRIDTMVDNQLDECSNQDKAAPLKGEIGVAGMKMIYKEYQRLFESERFRALAKHGAKAQRVLWGSTGTKNSNYSDTLYVDSLIAPNTVNTIPIKTIEAFVDHGKAESHTIFDNVPEAEDMLRTLDEIGVSLPDITAKLLEDGLKSFAKSYDDLIETIKKSMVEVGHAS
ncbi:MAG: transaldolase [candidate division Zixibacteria bacterium]|nr:transaldolase [candidate division Zixibacteria bacterium]